MWLRIKVALWVLMGRPVAYRVRFKGPITIRQSCSNGQLMLVECSLNGFSTEWEP